MLRKVHRWMGLILMLPLMLQGLTGALLIIIPLLLPGPPSVGDNGPRASTEAMIAASRASTPAGMIPLRFAPPAEGRSAIVTYGPPGERHPTFEVFVNPVHPAVMGTYTIPATIRFLHTVHADLFLLPYGQNATGIMGIVLTAMAVTGLIIWCPPTALWQSGKWRRTTMVSRRARGLRLWRELHVSMGFWLSGMLLFMAVSGTILAFPFMRPLFGDTRPAPPHQHLPSTTAAPGEAGLDAALQALRTRMPEATLLSVQLGDSPARQSLEVILPTYGANRPASMHYDAQADSLRLTRDPGQQRNGERSFQWLHMMHEARLVAPHPVAIVWKAMVLACGVGLVFFSLSGGVMWVMRRRNSARRKAPVMAG
ncbi:PepSY domain-containing protein [Komagataeibacter medellinensis]|uniref:PepSY domain-containing protein n=1 Tax=Komagataeibacter medellinensis TaxID=1177712 RepID=A0ABQ6VWX0_9PROT|nr:PepSY-associated TM helix domain-containing protein [Komagataeibacter medellinensis]KAB8124557.1 PepSY domain-containing protein [Komagataeibacter medellinensis]